MPKGKLSSQLYFVSYEKDTIEPTPSERPRIIKEDKSDDLVAWQIQEDIYILAAMLLVGVIFVIGLLFKKVENILLFALFMSGILIALFFALLR